MKNNYLVNLVAACIICGGIIFAGIRISESMSGVPYVPSVFDVNVAGQTASDDYLLEYEAADYLKITYETMEDYIQSGKLDGTYTTIEGEYIFSKEKLKQYMDNLIASE